MVTGSQANQHLFVKGEQYYACLSFSASVYWKLKPSPAEPGYVVSANSVDQLASDLDVHCLPLSM